MMEEHDDSTFSGEEDFGLTSSQVDYEISQLSKSDVEAVESIVSSLVSNQEPRLVPAISGETIPILNINISAYKTTTEALCTFYQSYRSWLQFFFSSIACKMLLNW